MGIGTTTCNQYNRKTIGPILDICYSIQQCFEAHCITCIRCMFAARFPPCQPCFGVANYLSTSPKAFSNMYSRHSYIGPSRLIVKLLDFADYGTNPSNHQCHPIKTLVMRFALQTILQKTLKGILYLTRESTSSEFTKTRTLCGPSLFTIVFKEFQCLSPLQNNYLFEDFCVLATKAFKNINGGLFQLIFPASYSHENRLNTVAEERMTLPRCAEPPIASKTII